MHKQNTSSTGFTIVELLVVVVVIAILAAISIVAYTGIQDRARVATVQSDLRQMSQLLEIYNLDEGGYPANYAQVAASGIKAAVSMPTNNRALLCGNSTGYVLFMSSGRANSAGGTSEHKQFKIGSETPLTEVNPLITWSSSVTCGSTPYPSRDWNNLWGSV